MAQTGKLPEHRGNKKAGMECWAWEMSDWEQIGRRRGQGLTWGKLPCARLFRAAFLETAPSRAT